MKELKAYFKNVYVGLGVILVVASIFGLYYTADTTLAKAADLKRVEIKVDRFILSQQIGQLQNRIWQIEDRFGRDPSKYTPEWRQEYRCLQRDLREARRKQDALDSK